MNLMLSGKNTTIDMDVKRNFTGVDYKHIYSVINYNESY